MRFLLALLVVLVSASAALAQSSAACSTAALSGTITVTSPTFNWTSCHAAAEAADGIAIEVNGSTTLIFQSPTPEAPNAAGKQAFPVSITLSTRGNHTIRTAAFTRKADGSLQGVGPFSAPFVLAYEKAVPATAPTNHPR